MVEAILSVIERPRNQAGPRKIYKPKTQNARHGNYAKNLDLPRQEAIGFWLITRTKAQAKSPLTSGE